MKNLKFAVLGCGFWSIAVLFNELPGAVFSDAANKALQRGLTEFIKEDWKKVFESDNVMEQIRAIT